MRLPETKQAKRSKSQKKSIHLVNSQSQVKVFSLEVWDKFLNIRNSSKSASKRTKPFINFQSPSVSLAYTEYISHKNTSHLPIKKIYLCLFQWKKYLKDLPRKLNCFPFFGCDFENYLKSILFHLGLMENH